LTLTLNRVIRHTIMHQSSTSMYIPNFIEIGHKLFVDGRTDGRTRGCTYWWTDSSPSNVIRSTRRSRPNDLAGGRTGTVLHLLDYYMGCKLAPSGKYNKTNCAWRRCSIISNYLHHLLLLPYCVITIIQKLTIPPDPSLQQEMCCYCLPVRLSICSGLEKHMQQLQTLISSVSMDSSQLWTISNCQFTNTHKCWKHNNAKNDSNQ